MLAGLRDSLRDGVRDSMKDHSPTRSSVEAARTAPEGGFPMHKAAFEGDENGLRSLLTHATSKDLASLDSQGNTALHVAVIRGGVPAVEALLAAGAEVGARNTRHWNALDEAIARDDEPMVRLLYPALRAEWKREKARKKAQLLQVLRELPDFTYQLKWELGSSVFGLLLRHFAPDDTYTVTKLGTRLRIDGSLMGLDRSVRSVIPRWRRGKFSLLIDAEPHPAPNYFVNWEERAYVNMYKARKERLRDTDKQVQLLMEHGGEKVRLRTEGSHLRPVTTWTGKPSTAVIDGWETQEYQWSGQMTAVSRVKSAVRIPEGTSFEQYLLLPMPEDVAAETGVDTNAKPDRSRIWVKKAARARGEQVDGKKTGSREVVTRCWMAKNFPLELRQLLPLLEALGEANQHLDRAAAVMRQWSDQQLFPVKVQIPLMWTAHVTMQFKSFELLGPNHDAWKQGFFSVPEGFEETTMERMRGGGTIPEAAATPG